jgi:hypothetical protein
MSHQLNGICKESNEWRQGNYRRQHRTYEEGCNRGIFYISAFTLGTEEKNKESQGKREMFLYKPTITPRRPTKQKNFSLRIHARPYMFVLFSIFLFAFHLHWVTAYEISAANPEKHHTSHLEQQQMTDRHLHSNIPSTQRSSVGQGIWNPGITCQNSSAIPEINTKTQWGPEV